MENTASTIMGLYATKRIFHTHEFRKTNMISIQYLCSFYTLYLCKYNFRMFIGETADDTRLRRTTFMVVLGLPLRRLCMT